MSRTTKAITEEMVAACKAELKKYGIRGEIGRRLQAIISGKKYGISQVSKIYNISRETLMRWIRKFKHGGSKAFAVQAGRGVKPKLNCEQQEQIRNLIVKEGANLTAKKLQARIKKMFAIKVSESTARRLMKKLGFAYITPRPVPYYYP
ncbi:helix-turn-helix domain-containing protein [Wolbachia endosymbiont of Listronotus oregonensis]|uniref:helix-turn-helix domain-containing protein n=1 Tax=Wolbachia endosymbiont of Listronotus oregonensis TaxID=2969106 RepID=UPI00281602F4|nr:helix-turn-helix domain-containing protein [Wolbachia endosymbiont of Listronotus oregonensis]WMT84051.1 helix-turn-helix domain-containing protein [Wolbachia endosymbiont of Listronotus oregonensis]